MRIKKIECDDFEKQNLKNEESRIKIILEGSQSPAHRTGQGRTGQERGEVISQRQVQVINTEKNIANNSLIISNRYNLASTVTSEMTWQECSYK